MAVLKSVLCMYIKLAIMPGVLVVLAINFGDRSAIAGVKVGLVGRIACRMESVRSVAE